MKKFFYLIAFICSLTILTLCSCGSAEANMAVLWTNRPEFTRYAELFNLSQDRYTVIVHYVENPALELLDTETPPDLVIAPWLKGASIRKQFANLNSLLAPEKIDATLFYPELLALGRSDSKQIFLPVSFNLPAMIFRKNAVTPSDDFSISLDEIEATGMQYNKFDGNAATRMGFAPTWDTEFLYLAAKGFNASFEEQTDFFSWSETSLKNAVTALRKFTTTVNRATNYESDFQFKYLYNNAYSAIMSNRCLYQYLRSDALLELDSEKSAHIDFRWLSFDKKTPLDDEMLYAGICAGSKNKAAARAFLTFFFSTATQDAILAENAQTKLASLGFGIAGGFSSLKSITETSFPKYYPLLLAHLPQSSTFTAPHILPNNWLAIKKSIIVPYLQTACTIAQGEPVEQFQTLGNYINTNKAKTDE